MMDNSVATRVCLRQAERRRHPAFSLLDYTSGFFQVVVHGTHSEVTLRTSWTASLGDVES